MYITLYAAWLWAITHSALHKGSVWGAVCLSVCLFVKIFTATNKIERQSLWSWVLTLSWTALNLTSPFWKLYRISVVKPPNCELVSLRVNKGLQLVWHFYIWKIRCVKRAIKTGVVWAYQLILHSWDFTRWHLKGVWVKTQISILILFRTQSESNFGETV